MEEIIEAHELPEPEWPADPYMFQVCVALWELYSNPVTNGNEALRAWAYLQDIIATRATMEELIQHPVPMLALVATAMELQQQPYDWFMCSDCNFVKGELAKVLEYEPHYYGPESDDEADEPTQEVCQRSDKAS